MSSTNRQHAGDDEAWRSPETTEQIESDTTNSRQNLNNRKNPIFVRGENPKRTKSSKAVSTSFVSPGDESVTKDVSLARERKVAKLTKMLLRKRL